MKNNSLILLVILLVLTPFNLVNGGSRTFGLGLVIGAPTGINAKYWLQQDQALNFVLAYGWGYHRWGHYDYYSDDRCYSDRFYRENRGYCNDRYYDYDRYNYRRFHFHGDYLFHNFNVINSPERFPIYFGPGLNLESYRDGVAFGARGNLGIAWMHRTLPFDIFLEMALVLHLIPDTDLDFTMGLGSRYYF